MHSFLLFAFKFAFLPSCIDFLFGSIMFETTIPISPPESPLRRRRGARTSPRRRPGGPRARRWTSSCPSPSTSSRRPTARCAGEEVRAGKWKPSVDVVFHYLFLNDFNLLFFISGGRMETYFDMFLDWLELSQKSRSAAGLRLRGPPFCPKHLFILPLPGLD